MKLSKTRNPSRFSLHRNTPHSPAASAPGREPASLASLVAKAFARTHVTLRARMLRRLLLPVGPLALTVIAGGAFAKYVEHARWSRLTVSLEDAARVTSSQLLELVRYVEQSNPVVLQQVMHVVARDTTTMAALGVSVAAIVVQRLTNRDPASR